MKLEHEDTSHLENETASSCGTDARPAAKSRALSRVMLLTTGVALTLGISSCVSPYDSYGGGYGSSSVTYSSYSPGYRVASLPGGYRREMISGNAYYYHDGHYYRQGSGGYVVVEPPRNSRYYSDYSRRNQRQTYGRRDSRYGGGQIVTSLPRGYRELNHRGNTYYQSGDRYYSRQGSGYVIVNRPY